MIGKEYNDLYFNDLKAFRNINNLQNAVFIYGIQNDIQHILSQATIGILSSTDEGFPLSLLEYGLAKLPVVSTNVGYCPEIIKDNFTGLLFDPLDNLQLQEQLKKMILNKKMRDSFGLHLHELVIQMYSREKGMQLLLSKYSLL